ncbi:MAG: saccharopine dehydrogenase family protein [Fervidobacterium sp.]
MEVKIRMKIAVLGGAGKMGSGIVRDLVTNSPKEDIEEVVIADVNMNEARQLANELKDSRIKIQYLDVANKEEVRKLLENVDVCVNAVPTLLGYQIDIMLVSLEAKCPYMDLGGLGVWTRKQKEYHQKFLEKGVPALLGMGSAPGITNILAKCCAEHLDKVEKINLYWVGKLVGQESPIFVPPYNILTLIDEYSEPNFQFINGEMKVVPALSGEQILDLPEPFGRTKFWYTPHSETSTIPYAKGFRDKGIKECTWRLSIPEHVDIVMRSLMSCGFGDKEPLKLNDAEISPQKFLALLVDRNIKKNKEKIPTEVKDYELYFAIGEGEKDGQKLKVTVELHQLPDLLYCGYVDAGTSMSASVGAQMVGKGEIPPGVWAPEECINTARFFEEMKRRKFKIIIKTETLL